VTRRILAIGGGGPQGLLVAAIVDRMEAVEGECAPEVLDGFYSAATGTIPAAGATHKIPQQYLRQFDIDGGAGRVAATACGVGAVPTGSTDTYIHERRFTYDGWTDISDRDPMLEAKETEGKHIVIETDGHWFRLVETADPNHVPTVRHTRRGNGTHWIAAE
jgi:hypothetical protein